VCGAPGCDEGTFLAAGDGVAEMAAGGDFIFFRRSSDVESKTLYRLDLRTRLAWPVYGTAAQPYRLAGGIAVDANGIGYWCREMPEGFFIGDVMKEGSSLEPSWCNQLALTATHLYIRRSDGLFRRELGKAGQTRVGDGEAIVFTVTDDYAFTTSRTRISSTVSRTALADPSRSEPILTQAGDLFMGLVADKAHVYVVTSPSGLIRVPVGGGEAEVVWRVDADNVVKAALTETHVYWSVTTAQADKCGEARVYRRLKAGGLPSLISAVPGYCAIDLLVHRDHVYSAIAEGTGVGPSRILRIRQ
jgi:hypothetical protein